MPRSPYPRLVHVVLLAGLVLAVSPASAEPYRPRVGAAHAQIVLPTIDGQGAIALSRFRGRKVLLVHFASW